MRDRNAELKKVNMETGLEERVELRDEMDEVKEALARRDKEVGAHGACTMSQATN